MALTLPILKGLKEITVFVVVAVKADPRTELLCGSVCRDKKYFKHLCSNELK